jgi:pyruvate dehydrogenase E2 component (dihydrolipoamide acetyltransferase)
LRDDVDRHIAGGVTEEAPGAGPHPTPLPRAMWRPKSRRFESLCGGYDGRSQRTYSGRNRRSHIEIADELNAKAKAARDRTIEPADLKGGTFTIIRHPEAAILGVGRIQEKPVAIDGRLEVRDRIGFSFSYDHRLIDGVTAEQFVGTVIKGIEDPDVLLSRIYISIQYSPSARRYTPEASRPET